MHRLLYSIPLIGHVLRYKRQVDRIEKRLVELTRYVVAIERHLGVRDNTLHSGERIVGDSLDHLDAVHRARYDHIINTHIAASCTPKRLLDIACGIGYGTCMMARAFTDAESFVGIDVSEDAIDYAQQHYAHDRVRYRSGTQAVIEPHEHFDMITCLETIEHIADDVGFLTDIIAHLQAQGTLWISVPNERVVPLDLGQHNHFHYRHYDYDALEQTLHSLGVHVTQAWHLNASDAQPQIAEGPHGACMILQCQKMDGHASHQPAAKERPDAESH